MLILILDPHNLFFFPQLTIFFSSSSSSWRKYKNLIWVINSFFKKVQRRWAKIRWKQIYVLKLCYIVPQIFGIEILWKFSANSISQQLTLKIVNNFKIIFFLDSRTDRELFISKNLLWSSIVAEKLAMTAFLLKISLKFSEQNWNWINDMVDMIFKFV